MSDESNHTRRNPYSLDTSLLDYEGLECDYISVWGDNVDSLLDDNMATRTPSFEKNGTVMNTPKTNGNMEVDNDTDTTGVKKDVEEVMGHLGCALVKFKDVTTKLGIRIPPTPRALPSPMIRAASAGTFRAPTPLTVPFFGRLTPGAPVVSGSGSAMHGIVQKYVGATPFSSPRGTNATVIRRTPMATPTRTTGSTPAATKHSPPVSTSAVRDPPLPANNRSDMVLLTVEEFQKMKEEAGKFQQL